MKNFDQTCRAIDWTELSRQKQTLLKARANAIKPRERENLTGIVNLIDALQDAAIDVHGVPESKVFPSLKLIRLAANAKKNKN